MDETRSKRLVVAALAVIAVTVVALGVWVFLIRDDDDPASPAATTPTATNPAELLDAPRIVDEAALRRVAGSVGHPVYWAGARGGQPLELTNTSDGRIYIRYLPANAKAGDPRPEFLTVGTYPVADAVKTLRETSKGKGFHRLDLDRGGIATYDERRPGSVHMAYRGSDFEIEVYDPSPKRALKLVTQGKIIPLD